MRAEALVAKRAASSRVFPSERATQTAPQKLTFISAEASSTENTRVMVNDADAAPHAAGDALASLTLRFAPGAKSPVVVTLPPGTAVRETGRWNGWRRLESDRGAGWTR